MRPFLETHCIDCHDDTVQKGGVRLDELTEDFIGKRSVERWVNVLDQIQSGAMPPKKKERPPVAEAKAVTQWLHGGLLDGALTQRKTNGATIIRRLNRTEYENTVRELLGTKIDLQEMLPEDARADGFDNVGSALNTSSILMERYLEAADAALDAAITREAKPETVKLSLRYLPSNIPGYLRDKTMFALPEDVVAFKKDGFILPGSSKNPGGLFRFRVHAWGHETEGKPVLFAVHGGRFYKETLKLLGYFQAPPNKEGVIEFTATLPSGGGIKITPYPFAEGEPSPGNAKAMGLAVREIEMEGPLMDQWPPASYRNIFGDAELQQLSKAYLEVLKYMKPYGASRIYTPFSKQPEADTERIVRAFLPRAFRRPVDAEEAQIYVQLALTRLKNGGTFEESVRVGLKAALCSPSFIFLRELPGKLDDYALAARLSYFLWSNQPDGELLALAEKKSLSQPAMLKAQVERLLKDPKAKQFSERFTDQWLELRNIDVNLPDGKLYPEFDEWLQISMLSETRAFFDELLAKDLGVANFVDSDFLMLNGRLAHHYGISGVAGTDLKKVKLEPGTHRGGVLTQASVLKVSANGTNTSPVIRGNWVLRNIMGKTVPPPPPGTPAIEPDIRGAQSIRDQMVKHREAESCASCHDKLDPPGFALENFDPIGGWRDQYRGLGTNHKSPVLHGRKAQYHPAADVDASGEILGGSTFKNIDEFKKLLLSDHEQIVRCVTEKLMIYSTGHSLSYADRASVQKVVDDTRAKDFGLRSLVHAVVQSETFLNK